MTIPHNQGIHEFGFPAQYDCSCMMVEAVRFSPQVSFMKYAAPNTGCWSSGARTKKLEKINVFSKLAHDMLLLHVRKKDQRKKNPTLEFNFIGNKKKGNHLCFTGTFFFLHLYQSSTPNTRNMMFLKVSQKRMLSLAFYETQQKRQLPSVQGTRVRMLYHSQPH